jgi:3-phenylpropionate/trans-cinnamate dioxygenase ferredoxin subunit
LDRFTLKDTYSVLKPPVIESRPCTSFSPVFLFGLGVPQGAWFAFPSIRSVCMRVETVTGTKASDIRRGTLALIEINGTRITVANVDGTYYAFDDTCTHEQCSLAEGDLEGTKVICMCHGAEFDVKTGNVLAPPAKLPLKVYPVRVSDDVLHIEV